MRRAGDGAATSAQGKGRLTSNPRATPRGRETATPRGRETGTPRGRETSATASPAPSRIPAASKAKAKTTPSKQPSELVPPGSARAKQPASARAKQPVSNRFAKAGNKSASPPKSRPAVRAPRGEVPLPLPADDSPLHTDQMDAADDSVAEIDVQAPAVAPAMAPAVEPAAESESPQRALVCDSTLQPIESHAYPKQPSNTWDGHASATVSWSKDPQEIADWQDQIKDAPVAPVRQSFANEAQTAANTGAVQPARHSELRPSDMMNELSWRLQNEWQPPAVHESETPGVPSSVDHQARVSRSRMDAGVHESVDYQARVSTSRHESVDHQARVATSRHESVDHQARVSTSRTAGAPTSTSSTAPLPGPSPRVSVPTSTSSTQPVLGSSPRVSVDTKLDQEEDNEELKALAERLEKGVETLVGMASGATGGETNKAGRRDTHLVISQMQQEIAELKARVGVGRTSTVSPSTSAPMPPVGRTSTVSPSNSEPPPPAHGMNNAGGADGGAGGEVLHASDPQEWPFRNSHAAALAAASQPRGLLMYGQGNASTAPAASPGAALNMLWGASADEERTSEQLSSKGDLGPPPSAGSNSQMLPPTPASEDHLQHLLRDVYDKICVCSARVKEQKVSSEFGISDLHFNADSLLRAVTDDEVASRKETWKEIDCLRQALVSMHQHLQFAQQRTRVLEQQCQEYERHVQQLTQSPCPTPPLVATILPPQEHSSHERAIVGRAGSKPLTPRESRPVTPAKGSTAQTPNISRPVSPSRGFASPMSAQNVSYWAPSSASRAPSAAASFVASTPQPALGLAAQPLSARGQPETRASSAPRSASAAAAPRVRVMRVSGGTTPVLPVSASGSLRVATSREATPRKMAPSTPMGSSVYKELRGADGSVVFEPYMTVSPACLPWVSAVADGFLTPSPMPPSMVSPSLPSSAAGSYSAPGPRTTASPAPAAQRLVGVSSSASGAHRLASPSPKPGQRLAHAPHGFPSFLTLLPGSQTSTPAPPTPRSATMTPATVCGVKTC